MDKSQRKQRDLDERISLAGLDPQDALRALLQVDPDAEPVEKAEDDTAEDDPSPKHRGDA